MKGNGERKVRRCEKDYTMSKVFMLTCIVCGCYKSQLFAGDQGWNVLQLFGLMINQIDAGRSVQSSILCVTVCHLEYSNLSLALCTYVINFNL